MTTPLPPPSMSAGEHGPRPITRAKSKSWAAVGSPNLACRVGDERATAALCYRRAASLAAGASIRSPVPVSAALGMAPTNPPPTCPQPNEDIYGAQFAFLAAEENLGDQSEEDLAPHPSPHQPRSLPDQPWALHIRPLSNLTTSESSVGLDAEGGEAWTEQGYEHDHEQETVETAARTALESTFSPDSTLRQLRLHLEASLGRPLDKWRHVIRSAAQSFAEENAAEISRRPSAEDFAEELQGAPPSKGSEGQAVVDTACIVQVGVVQSDHLPRVADASAKMDVKQQALSSAAPQASEENGNLSEEQLNLKRVKRGILILQGAMRKRRWRLVLSKKIPIIRGPCGMSAYPIFKGNVRVGTEGPTSGRQYRHSSCGCLHPGSRTRELLIFIVEWPWFDRLSLLAVIVNCMTMAAQGPPGAYALFDEPESQVIELIFTLVFSFEMAIKVGAMGFWGHHHAYLADGWNRLDGFIVALSWPPLLFPSLGNVNVIRGVRALRPLRTVSRLPGMKRQVDTIFHALPRLFDVAMLSAFILVILGVLGVQLFKGTLRYRCYEALGGVGEATVGGASASNRTEGGLEGSSSTMSDAHHLLPDVSDPQQRSSMGASGWRDTLVTASGRMLDSAVTGALAIAVADPHRAPIDLLAGVCAPDAAALASGEELRGTCAAGEVCLPYDGNPFHETISFDNIVAAWVTIFQCITLDGWTAVMYMTSKSSGVGSTIYFLSLVFFASLYLLNLFLAVIWHTYTMRAEEKVHAKTKAQAVEGKEEGGEGEEARSGVAPTTGGDDPSRLSRWNCLCVRLNEAPCFTVSTTGLILINVGLMNLDRYPIEEEEETMLERANIVITLLFALEMAIKLIALGCSGYWGDAFNRVDGIIVVLSSLDILNSVVDVGINPQMLRAFRLLRILKLLRSWKSLQRLIGAVLGSAESLSYLMLLCTLVLFVFALLGLQLFGNQFNPPAFPQPPRASFDSIDLAMTTVFIVMMGEGWAAIWEDTSRAVGGACFFYFLLLIVVASYMLLNLVVAVLLGSFTGGKEKEEDDATGTDSPLRSASPSFKSSLSRPGTNAKPDSATAAGVAGVGSCCGQEAALGCLGPQNALRAAAKRLISHPSFDSLIIALILVSSASMTFDSCTLDPGSHLASMLERLDILCTAVFVFEMCTKILALGLICMPGAYLRSSWNCLDGFIVTASLLSGSNPAFRTLRVLRVLRPLRLISRFEGLKVTVTLLLKVMPRVLDVLLVYVLFLDVFAILGVQFFAGKFASCVSSVEDLTLEPSVISTREACEAAGHRWRNPTTGHFDSAPAAALQLFEMSTLEGWVEVLWMGIDATSIGHAPVRDASRSQSLFFVSWIILGATFLLNLFVGVLVATFAEIKRADDLGDDANDSEDDDQSNGSEAPTRSRRVVSTVGVTERQAEWLETMAQLVSSQPKPRQQCPEGECRGACFKLVKHPSFDHLILVVILFNTMLMALDGYGLNPWQSFVLLVLNNVCSTIFLGECVIKIIAFTFSGYLSEAWNVFDFSVVMLTIVDFLVTYVAADLDTNPTLMRVLRMLRITRILRTFRVIKSARSLRMLLSMLVFSMPALINILGLFLIITSMFALLAMQIFGSVAFGESLNDDANFCTFSTSVLTLFRCATGEAWNSLMHDVMVTPESGRCTEEDGNCGSVAAIPFFVIYVTLSTFIVLKMMIALSARERACPPTRPDAELACMCLTYNLTRHRALPPPHCALPDIGVQSSTISSSH